MSQSVQELVGVRIWDVPEGRDYLSVYLGMRDAGMGVIQLLRF